MRKAIRRLRLREGDIVVVKDPITMDALRSIYPIKGVPSCPVVFAPEGIRRLGRKYLEKLLMRTEIAP